MGKSGIEPMDAIFHSIGRIAAYWQAIEGQLELFILHKQDIPPATGLILACNVGFRSKMDLMYLFLNEGDIKPEPEATELRAILARINDGYAKRNQYVHAILSQDDFGSIKRMGIRTKGGKLKTINEPVTPKEVFEAAEFIRLCGRDLAVFMERNGLVTSEPTENPI